MAADYDQRRKERNKLLSRTETVSWLHNQELALPRASQGRLRVRLNLAVETASNLEDYLACLVENDAFVMFSFPTPPDKQALTWLQAEPLSVLRALLPKHLDVFGRWGAQLSGEFPEDLAELLATAGIVTWQGGPLAEYFAAGQGGTLPDCLCRYASVDRLAHDYHRAGIPVRREVRGLRTSTLIPPGLLVALIVLEAKLAQAQGVTNLSAAYSLCGHLLQDVAALRALATLTAELSATVICLPWTGGSLLGLRNLTTVAAWTAATSALGSAQGCEVVAVDKDQPLTSDQVSLWLDLAQGVSRLATDQQQSLAAAVSQEEEQVRTEAEAIINRVLELGDGEVAPGLEPALAEGSLDLPLAPAGICRGQVLSARDATGAVRFLDCGALPLPPESKELHIQLLEERARSEGRELGISMVIDDVYAFSKGALVGRIK